MPIISLSRDEFAAAAALAKAVYALIPTGKGALIDGNPHEPARRIAAAIDRDLDGVTTVLGPLIAAIPAVTARTCRDTIVDESVVAAWQRLAAQLGASSGSQVFRRVLAAYRADPTMALPILEPFLDDPAAFDDLIADAVPAHHIARLLDDLAHPEPTRDLRVDPTVALRTRAILLCFLLTGLRRKHVFDLRWGDLVFASDTLTITHHKRRYVVHEPSFGHALDELLTREHRRATIQPEDRLWDARHDVASDPRNGAFGSWRFTSSLDRATDRLHLPRITYHRLLATYAKAVFTVTGSRPQAWAALIPTGTETTDVVIRVPTVRGGDNRAYSGCGSYHRQEVCW